MSVKWYLAYNWVVLFTSVDKRHLAYNWAVLFTSVDKRYYIMITYFRLECTSVLILDSISVWLLPWMGLMMLAHSQYQLSLFVYVVVFGFYQDVFDRGLLLTKEVSKLKSCYWLGWNNQHLIYRYGTSVSQMNTVFSVRSHMIYQRIFDGNSTMDTTSGAGTDYHVGNGYCFIYAQLTFLTRLSIRYDIALENIDHHIIK